MGWLQWPLAIVAGLLALTLLAGRLGLLAGQPPASLGAPGGRLAPPSSTPNSVSSQAAQHPDHPRHLVAQVDPLPLTGDPATAMARLAEVLSRLPGAQVQLVRPDYLHATFTSRWLRFVDDVEAVIDPAAGVIHIRSASRIGHGDRGVNRARVEAIRATWAAAGSSR